MPRFKVFKQFPARYVETYVVDAGSEEEAQRAVVGGLVRCKHRSFETTPGAPQPSNIPITVTAEFGAAPGGDFAYPAGQGERMDEFNNGRFLDSAGSDMQRAVQEVE